MTEEGTQKFLKILWFFTLFTSFFGKLLCLPEPYDFISAYRIGLVINDGLFVILFLKNQHLHLNRKLYQYYIFLAFWFIWAGISILWAGSKGMVLVNMLFTAINISLIFFTSCYFTEEKDHAKFIKITFVAFAISVVFAFVEMAAGIHVPYSKSLGYYGTIAQYIPTGFYINPNDFAAYLVTFMPIAYMLFKYAKKYNYVYFCIFTLALYVLLYTDSRSSYLALFIAVVAAIALDIYSKRKCIKLPPDNKFKNILAVIAIIIVIIINSTGIGQIHREVHNAGEQAIGNQLSSLLDVEQETSIGVRINLIKNGFKILNQNPLRYLTGVGAGNTEYYMQNYVDSTMGIVDMHNWWMEILVNHGIIFLLLFIWFYVRIIYDTIIVYKETDSELYRMASGAIIISLAAFSIASISSSSIAGLSTIWIIFGEAMALIGCHHKRRRMLG